VSGTSLRKEITLEGGEIEEGGKKKKKIKKQAERSMGYKKYDRRKKEGEKREINPTFSFRGQPPTFH